jgi:PAS domain S-box-containing protein
VNMTEGQIDELLRAENQRLRDDLQELRSRLWEPEEIVRAIRQGEVDALVVSEAPGEQIYSLRRADLLHRQMVEEMKEGAAALDGDGRIIYCNACFAALVRAEPRQVVGALIATFVTEAGAPFFDGLRPEGWSKPRRAELALRAASGDPVPVLATMNHLTVDREEVFCLIVSDLEERRRAEQLLDESRRKDEFLAMLAHELRNPLAPIRQAAQILRLRCPPDPELQQAREVIDRQITHVTRLVDDLLDVSRITRGKIRLERAAVDLGQVIARGVETAAPQMQARRHELVLELPPERLQVEGDATRLAQVVSNVLDNAVKFTPEHGRITLAVTRQGALARIAVRDTGIGISREMLPRIFDLFAQADSSPARAQGGLGIGLTLVRTLVEMHGGSVEVDSAGPGLGTEVVLRLPVTANSTGAAGQKEQVRPSPVSGRRIMVVDDGVDAADTLAALIRCWGHEVLVAFDGPSALAEAAAFRPELMFIDIGLPGMNGHELARRVRALPEMEGVMLIALTGYGQEEDLRRSKEAGFDQHWVKPFDDGALERLWQSWAAAEPPAG